MPGCPHENIVYCPLYLASHEAGGFGCDDGQLGYGGCAADRGLDYAATIERLRAHNPRIIADCEWRQAVDEGRAQRDRNMRAAGIH